MSNISNVNTETNSVSKAKETRNISLSKNIAAPTSFNYYPPLVHAVPFIPQHPADSHANLVIIQHIEPAEVASCSNETDASKLSVKTEDIVDDTDPSVNLHSFFMEQLRESKDRMYLLRLEDQFISLIQDSPHSLHYQHITSYHRMLIHRMATYFGLDHTLDDDGTGVNVTKTAKSRIPETRFCDLIPAPQEGEQGEKEPVTILRRKDPTEQPIQPNPQIIRPVSPPSSDSETKSIKEREENYALVRARIFEGEANEGELVPTPIRISSEESTPESDCEPPAHASKNTDTHTLAEAPVIAPVPPQVFTPNLKEEAEAVPTSNSNNKSHSGTSNSRRRSHDNNNNNRHLRTKNSFQNQTAPQVPFPPLVVPSNVPYLPVGSFCNPQQNDPRPMYPFPLNPPLSSHNSLPTFSIPPNFSLLPSQPSIPISNQHFLTQTQHSMRGDSPTFIPDPHMPSPPPLPQSAMQVPLNPTPAINPSFAHYPANLSMMNMGMQAPNASLLQRGANPSYQGMPPVSDVMNFIPQAPPNYESAKEDGYILMPGYQQMGTPPYPTMQWEQSGPGVLKLKHPASPLSSQLQMPQTMQQLASSLEMMGIHPGEEQMYLHSNHKHMSPGGEMYPNYAPLPNQMNPNAPMPGQGMYIPNNFAAVMPYQYPNQEGAIHPPINPSAMSMPNSRYVANHIPIPEPGFPHMMTPRPVHNMVPNMTTPHSHTNGQQHPFVPLNQMNAQMLQVQQSALPNPHSVNNQPAQDFQMNNQNFKNHKHSKSTEMPFSQENNRSKPNRHSNSRAPSDKSRHRTQQQNSFSEQQKSSGSIYIPPRAGGEPRSQGSEKDGLLPTPASMRILEIFDLKISFQEAEMCIRKISPVNVTFHCLKPTYSNQEVLLGIFDSDEVTDILNKINSNPTVEFKTRFPDQTLIKYLSSTILQQPTASN